jgi:starch synthase
VPVVCRTGGLADTVIDANVAAMQAGVATGIQFGRVDLPSLSTAISRATALYRQPEQWRAIQRNGMKSDFSWARSGKAYADLYTQLVMETR